MEDTGTMARVVEVDAHGDWTFLTNHTHVLLCLAADPDVLLREVAQRVGITERAAQSIVRDLGEAGYVTRTRVGRSNHYSIEPRGRLRHPLESHRTIEILLDIVDRPDASGPSRGRD